MARSYTVGGGSLCQWCKNYKCAWIKDGKPVKGWEAKKTVIHESEKEVESYKVVKCPEFLTDEDFDTVRCEYCNKVLFRYEKRHKHGVVSIKCRRCGKINLIFSK